MHYYLNPHLTLIERGSWILLESGGGWISPHLLDHLKTLWKTKKFFFDFLKVHNELGKVTKFWTSRPLFSWRNSHLKKVRADSAPRPNRVKYKQFLYWNPWTLKYQRHWFDLILIRQKTSCKNIWLNVWLATKCAIYIIFCAVIQMNFVLVEQHYTVHSAVETAENNFIRNSKKVLQQCKQKK